MSSITSSIPPSFNDFSCQFNNVSFFHHKLFFVIISVTGKIMSMIERLGSFTITAAEMKYLISLLQIQNLSNKVSCVDKSQ